MLTVISVLVVLSGILPVVLSHPGVDPLIGTASHYTPIRFARTACEGKIGSSKLPRQSTLSQQVKDYGIAELDAEEDFVSGALATDHRVSARLEK
ncbi:hypothetical protein SLA2020_445120 [Shorea laevis]